MCGRRPGRRGSTTPPRTRRGGAIDASPGIGTPRRRPDAKALGSGRRRSGRRTRTWSWCFGVGRMGTSWSRRARGAGTPGSSGSSLRPWCRPAVRCARRPPAAFRPRRSITGAGAIPNSGRAGTPRWRKSEPRLPEMLTAAAIAGLDPGAAGLNLARADIDQAIAICKMRGWGMAERPGRARPPIRVEPTIEEVRADVERRLAALRRQRRGGGPCPPSPGGEGTEP